MLTKTQIAAEIEQLVKSEGNKYFDRPLVGFSSANDTLYRQFKRIIGAYHMTPAQVFKKEFTTKLKEGTVISWVLPFNQEVRKSNRTQSKFPSREWAHGRYYGEMVNNRLREYIPTLLSQHGQKGIAPMKSESWQRFDETIGHTSNWSERHAAFVSGLGTFSLSDGLITPAGVAHRCGNVVTDLVLAPSPRDYSTPYEYCLYFARGECGECIKRCPGNAINKVRHDKKACSNYINTFESDLNEKYQVGTSGCGLCQTKVACEHKIPL